MSDLQLISLTQDQRIECHHKAKDAVIALAGARPQRSQFKHTHASKYPTWIVGLVVFLAVVMLVVAFIPSAIRLYHIGKTTFGHSIVHAGSQNAVGVCTIFLAEIGSLLFTLAFAVLPLQNTGRNIMKASIVITTLIALAGNYEMALLGKSGLTLFAWLEALAPPILTLSTAYALKEIMLESVANRHADNRAYDIAVQDWQAKTAQPDQHSDYLRFYVNALWDAITETNASGKGAKERRDHLKALNAAGKSALVRAEIDADNWYQPISQAIEIKPVAIEPTAPNFTYPPQPILSTNGNGHHP